LFASRILAGITAGNLAACQAAIADVSEGPERAKGMGRVGAGIGLGMVFGPIAGGTLSQLGPWAPPVGAALMAALDLVAAFLYMPETHPPGPARDATKSRTPRVPVWKLVNSQLSIVLCMYFLVFLCITTLQVALALITKLRLGWTAVEVGHVFGLFGVVMLVVQGLLPNWLAKTFGEIRVVTAGTLFAAGGLTCIAFSRHALSMTAGLVLLAVGLGLTQPFLAALAARQVDKQSYGSALGLAQSAGGLARVVGPLLGGVLYERLSPAAPFLGGAGAAVIAFCFSLALRLVGQPADTRA
jgi:DHA1 family tetracycline resistance protein-like MFS transporter